MTYMALGARSASNMPSSKTGLEDVTGWQKSAGLHGRDTHNNLRRCVVLLGWLCRQA
jgi:hypothetical protein